MVTSTQTALLVQGSRVIYLTGEGSPPFPTSDSPPSPTSDSPPSPASDSPSFPASDFGSRSTTPDSFQQNFGYGEPEYDFDCDSDMSDSASLSPSYHSAGQGSARHYRAQLKRNEITALDFFADDYFRLGKFAFPPEALTPQAFTQAAGKAFAKPSLKEEYAHCLKHLVQYAKLQEERHFTEPEWQVHHGMHAIMFKIIEPRKIDEVRGWGETYDAAPHMWNYAPKCFEYYTDLSQPTVDTAFAICANQGVQEEGSPLYRICEQVAKQDYLHLPRQRRFIVVGISDLPEMIELLSTDTLELMHSYEETSEISYCTITSIEKHGNITVFFVEIKRSNTEPLSGQCVNQAVNAAAFLCGKQIDLIDRATSIDPDFVTLTPFSLGMTITGSKWKILAVTAVRATIGELSPKMYYHQVAEGDWVNDPKTFIGAVLTMHEIMLDHIVKLFVSCLRVIVADMKAREGKKKEHGGLTPREGKLPERVVKKSVIPKKEPNDKKSDKQPKSNEQQKSDEQPTSDGQQMSHASQLVSGFDKLDIGQQSQDPFVSE